VKKLAAALCLSVLAAAVPAAVPHAAVNNTVNGPEPALSDEIADQAMGAMLFVFLHELGHGLIDQLGLPAVGPEEDVVDEFATVLLTKLADEADGLSKSAIDRVLASGALSWYHAWRQTAPSLDHMDWWDEHSPDIKRFYAIICLAYGADQQTFGRIARETGVPAERLETCITEYQAKRSAWDRLLAPHLITPEQPRSRNGGRLVVEYGPARSHRASLFERRIKSSIALAEMIEHFNASVDLPRNITILFTDCGEANAYYFPGDHKIHMCYELMAEHAKLFEVAIAKGEVDLMLPPASDAPGNDVAVIIPETPDTTPDFPPDLPPSDGGPADDSAEDPFDDMINDVPIGGTAGGTNGGGANGSGPPVADGTLTPAPGTAPVGDAAMLVGTWQGEGWNIYGADATITFSFKPDGSFEQTSVGADGFNMRLWGHYRLADGRLDLAYDGWDPAENCSRRYGGGLCGTIQLGEGDVFDVTASADVISLPMGDFTRLR